MNQRGKLVGNNRSNLGVPPGWSHQDRRFGESLKQNLDVLVGQRGDKLDRAVTFRDLLDSGIVVLASGVSNFDGNAASIGLTQLVPNLDIPPAPTNLTANGAFQNIIIGFDLKLYQGHSHVELWRNTTDNIATATLSAQISGFTGTYADPAGSGNAFYYWVRAANQNGIVGPYNSSAGTLGQTAPDVDHLLNTLTDAITESQLGQALESKLDGFEDDIADLETTFASTTAAATSAAAAAASENAAIAAKTVALGAETAAVAAKTAALLAQSNAETAEDDAVIAKTSAETARSGAQTSETASSNSATGAAGSASSAGTSATAAANSATASGNSATAAATSESNANTYATNAGTGASASNAAKLAAETAQSGAETAETNSVSSANSAAGSASNASSSATTAANAASAAGASAGAAATSESNASGYVTDAETASTASTAAKVAAEAARTGSVASAAASAASAATASASESAAGQSASAANTAKLAAETAESDALTYKNQAVNSASNASGSASTASQQAGLASGSETAAGNSASAASDSAGTASTKAGEASSSADAAEVSRLAAVAGQAGAVNAAAAALVSANAASASSGAAGQSASTASSQAGIATTKAGEASTFAANSANSASAADGSATAASSTVNGLTARLNNAGGTGVTVEQQFSANASSLGTLEGQYTVKIDANGSVAGFGLANTTTAAGNNTTEFYVNADRFAIMPDKATTTDPTWSSGVAYANGARVIYSGSLYIAKVAHTSSGSNVPPNASFWVSGTVVPFAVQATGFTAADGTYVPPGVYMNSAMIKHAAITAAQIGTLNADVINAGFIDADRIDAASINASKLNIDGSSITSVVVNGVPTLQLGDVNVNKLTGNSISATIMSGTTVYANRLTGDVTTIVPFRTTTSTYFNGPSNEVTLQEVDLPATTHVSEGHKIYASAGGYISSTSGKVYYVKMYIRSTPSSAFVLAGEMRVKSNTNSYVPFSVFGVLNTPTTGIARMKLTIRRYGTNGTTPDASTTANYVRERQGAVMGIH